MRVICKKVTGTGATINVELGFTPDFVRVLNATDRKEVVWDTNDEVNTHGMDIAAAGDKTAAATAAAGLAVYAGSAATYSKGVTIGATASVNTNTNKLIVIAGCYDL